MNNNINLVPSLEEILSLVEKNAIIQISQTEAVQKINTITVSEMKFQLIAFEIVISI